MSTYKIGTVTVSNGSTAVTGSGTGWVSAGIRAGDFLFVNGLFGEIASVEGNTALTLVRGWPGSNASGQQYSIALIDDGQRSISSLNQVLQALGQGTLTSLAALSASANEMPYWTGEGVMGKTALTAAARRLIGRAVIETQSNTDSAQGRLLRNHNHGIGVKGIPNSIDALSALAEYPTGFCRVASVESTVANVFGLSHNGCVLWMSLNDTTGAGIVLSANNGSATLISEVEGVKSSRVLQTSQNTTVDSNGFLKAASPILKVFSDGVEEPVEPVGAKFERLDTGQYRVTDVEPLAETGWQIEVPQDHNGNRLVFVETAYDAATRTLTITATAPTWDSQAGVWAAGAPRDIPDGRWVDIRFCRVAGADVPDALPD